MRNLNLLKFSNSHIHLILGPILGTVLFLKAQGIRKCFYRLCILMFSFKTCICLHMVEGRKFSAFYEKKKTSYYIQYAAMFGKRNIILMESPFHTEDFGASFSCVDLSMRDS